MGMKRWLHARIGHLLGVSVFWCSCDSCRTSWTVPMVVSGALASLRRHVVDYHGGVDLSD